MTLSSDATSDGNGTLGQKGTEMRAVCWRDDEDFGGVLRLRGRPRCAKGVTPSRVGKSSEMRVAKGCEHSCCDAATICQPGGVGCPLRARFAPQRYQRTLPASAFHVGEVFQRQHQRVRALA